MEQTDFKYFCDPCNKGYTQKCNYNRHIKSRVCITNKDKIYECEDCDFVSRTQNKLTYHYKKCTKGINLNNNATVIYDSGLANANFVNGPSGGWNVKTWQEVK